MKIAAFILALCTTTGCLGIILPVPAAARANRALQGSAQAVLSSINRRAETLLRFETRHYRVRVYQLQGSTFLNVYNKETGFTDQNGVPARVEHAEHPEEAWQVYVNQQGDLHYLARVHPSGLTELEIRVPGGEPDVPEAGYNAFYSFPHHYLEEHVDSVLPKLAATRWTAEEETDSETLELTREHLKLILKFDPDTRLITYTQLIEVE